MIYDDVVHDLKLDPAAPFTMPDLPAFPVFGYKARKRLSGETNRVLRAAGFGDTKELVKDE